jgi:thiol-disulfide isomerase/thioredoxin
MSEESAPRSVLRFRLAIGLGACAVLGIAAFGVYQALREGAPATLAAADAAAPGWSSAPLALPEVRFQDGEGRPVSLADFRGKVVLLNLWATWCVPCREEMPALDRLQQALGGGAFEVVALSLDSGGAEAVRRFYDEVGVRALKVYVDPAMKASAALRVPGVPTTILVDRDGGERWRKTGPARWDAPEIVEALRARLGPLAAPNATRAGGGA